MIKIRTKEYTGPSPHAVAIRGRNPSKRLPEHLILERRRQDDKRSEAVKRTEEHYYIDLQMKWERNTNSKIVGNTIKRRVEYKLQERDIKLEERRQELRKMLDQEEYDHIQLAASMEETMEEKQARMRKKAETLKQKREEERQKIVREKLDCQWQNQCEELRSMLSRRHQDQVCLERKQQLELHAEIERERQAEEAMYAELWERDRLAKAAREEHESQAAMDRTYRMLDTLQEQRKQNTIRRAAEQAEVEQKAEELKSMRLDVALEAKEQKLLIQKEKLQYKRDLDKQVRIRSKAEKRDDNEELSMAVKVVEAAHLQDAKIQQELAEKRDKCRLEEARYREYLRHEKIEEGKREQEIERIIQNDVDKQEAKKSQKRAHKREARASYLQEVLECRKMQVAERSEEKAKELEEIQKWRGNFKKIYDKNTEYQRSQAEYLQNRNRQYNNDLLQQIEYKDKMKRRQASLDLAEYETGLQTEMSYESRLREILERKDTQKAHPLRRKCMENNRTVIFKE